jgi:hypothetical protein
MAIDTAEKRRSVAGVGFWVFGPAVTPNASKDAEWRQQAGWSYSGIAADVPVSSPDPPSINKIFSITRSLSEIFETR